MRDQNSEYISKLKLEDFKILLQEFDIELDGKLRRQFYQSLKITNMLWFMININLY